MRLQIKVLHGEEWTFNIPEDSTVLDLKRSIQVILNIATANQTLLVAGQILKNEKHITCYPEIIEGAKLDLIVAKPKKSEPISITDLHYALMGFFRKYYTEEESKVLSEEFMKNMDENISNLSLDDLERIATLEMKNGKVGSPSQGSSSAPDKN